VLLQALQEGTVTPSKSRESFPAGFVAVCTSNLSDLDNINDPLSDRLTSVHVTFNPHHAQNRRIVDLGFGGGSSAGGYVPEILLDTGVRMIEAWRLRMSDDNPDIGEVGSNRTLIDVASRTAAIATLEGRDLATADDLKAGLLHAMRGRIRARSGDAFAQNARRVEEFVGQHLEPSLKKSGTVYWCRFFRQGLRENRGEAESVVSEGRRLLQDAGLVERLALGEDGALFPRFASFRSYVAARESPRPPIREWDAAIAEFGLLERYGLFRCDEDTEGAEDDVAAAR
jgi:MoxR-like ATPase